MFMMGKSGVFDSAFFSSLLAVLFAGDVIYLNQFSFHLRNWALIQWSSYFCSEVAEQF